MRYYKVNKIEHCVYDPQDVIPDEIHVIKNWRDGRTGDWVMTDDGSVLQILYEGKMTRNWGKVRTLRYIRTCLGMYMVDDKVYFSSEKKKNVYCLGGSVYSNQRLEGRTKTTKAEQMFAVFLAQGLNRVEAYLKAFPTNNKQYALKRANILVGTERIKRAVKKELEPILKDLGIDEEYVLRGIKKIADGDNEKLKLQALSKLGDVLDIEDKNVTKVQQYSGFQFSGFSPEQIERAKRKEITDGDREVSQT